MSRRRKRRQSDAVELNLAAMLDMAFQLLTFFILTFRPAPIEGQLAIKLPPPQPATDVLAAQPEQQEQAPTDGNAGTALQTLILTVNAGADGNMSQVRMGMGVVFNGQGTPSNLHQLRQRLKQVFSLRNGPFDQVLIRVDRQLHYQELMKIVDICTQQRLPNGDRLEKLSFQELKP